MDELSNLRAIITEELQNLYVTEKLEKKVFSSIKKSKRFNFNLKYNWFRLSTVFSLLVILFTLSFNIIKEDKSINHMENQIVEKNDIEIPPRKKLLVSETYFNRFTVMKNFDEDINE